MRRSSFGLFVSAAFLAAGAAGGTGFFIASPSSNLSFARSPEGSATSTPLHPEELALPFVKHLPTPTPLKAVYMTQCVVGTLSFREELTKLIEETELNAVIIDIKDFSGGIAFPTDNPALMPYVSYKCGADDMEQFVEELHDKGIYVIGRITVFQDPLYTKAHPELAVSKESDGSMWKDYKGLSFIDVGARPFWEYIVELSKESYALGFDELNFDYIRFPSDGNMKDIHYPWTMNKNKQEALEEFFKYLHGALRPGPSTGSTNSPQTDGGQAGPVLSADLFGMTATNEDDLNIGQVLERALPYFDYIAPMVYPSHYPNGFRGYTNVNAHAYDIVHFSMSEAVRRVKATTTRVAGFTHTRIMETVVVPATHSTSSGQAATTATTTKQDFSGLYQKPSYPASVMRPWLQSFDYPVVYTPEMITEQIKATNDAGLDSYMFWDPANKYRSLRQVLQSQ